MEQESGNKGRLGGKFEDFEYSPRNEVWNRIESGAGSKASKSSLGVLFQHFEYAPNARVWRRVVREMYPWRRRRAVVWWSTAAGVALLAAFLIYRPFNGQDRVEMMATTELRKDFDGHTTVQVGRENVEGSGVDGENVVRDEERVNGGLRQGRGMFADDGEGMRQRRFREKEGQAVKGAPVALAHWNPSVSQRNVQIDWNSVMASDTIPVEEYAESVDSVPTEIPFFDEFDFKQEDEVMLASLETQVGSNLSPSGTSLKTFQSVDPRDAFVSPTLGFSSEDENLQASGIPEDYATPISFGAGLNKRIKKRWMIGGGISYTLMNSSAVYQNQNWETRSKITRRYIGPNVNISHEFIQRKRISAFSIAGMQYDIGINKKVTATDFNAGEELSETQVSSPLGNQAAALLGVGMNYNLTNNLRLYVQGTANHYFYQSTFNLWSEKPLWPSLQAGLRLGL